MPKFTADRVVTQGHVRYFYQPGGAGIGNELFYGGLDGQPMVIEDHDNPRVGARTAINIHDPVQAKRFLRVGNSVAPPDLPSATVQFMQFHGGVPQHLIGYDCPMNFYQVVGNCKDLSDILDGATDYWKIFSHGIHETSSEKGSSFDSDDALMDGLDFTFDAIYPVGHLGFGEEGAAVVDLEVVDGVYGSKIQCGACGPADNGTSLWYGVQINDTGVPPAVVYTVDGFGTVTSAAITGAADTDVPVAIDIVGRYLVVVYKGAADAGYFVAEINNLTGIPGTWTQVTTGFEVGGEPNDIWVSSPREVWFCGDGGYIYKSESILQGVAVIHEADVTAEDLLRITALDEILVSVGTNGAVVISYNRGGTFSAPTVAASANDLLAVAIWGDYEFWVGTDAGEVFYTKNRGETAWTELTVAMTLTQVDDIVWVNSEIGYISAETAGPVAVLLATIDGGQTWAQSNPLSGRVLDWAVFDRGNRISYPNVTNPGIATNYVTIAGLAGDGADGIILTGKANIIP